MSEDPAAGNTYAREDAPNPRANEAAESPLVDEVPEQEDADGDLSIGQQLWDSGAAGDLRPEDVPDTADRGRATDEEDSLYYEGLTAGIRQDFPRARRVGTVAGHDAYTARRDLRIETYNYYGEAQGEQRLSGHVTVDDLRHLALVHVTTNTDEKLRSALVEHKIVCLRGMLGTGRSDSAVTELDRLTGRSRASSKVIVLDGASGLAAALEQIKPGKGYLLDASDTSWTDTVGTVQVNQAREALGPSGFLVILLDPDASATVPAHVVDHEGPDLGTVAAFHLAVRLAGRDSDEERARERARSQAQSVIEHARRSHGQTRDWYQEITTVSAATPAEAVLFATAIWDWYQRRQSDPHAWPRVADFRTRHHHERAVGLLRQRDSADSPVRQSYAISAAVLDGMALSEVIDNARKLGNLLAEVEHPGEAGQRGVFTYPLARWLRHAELAPASSDSEDKGGGMVVRMPSRGLARAVIEVAWREYDAARIPILNWLTVVCELDRDPRVRVRAAQALAFIASQDYALVKKQVLDAWSGPSGRPIQQEAAAWLLEGIVLDGNSVTKVRNLLRRWSRSPEPGKRAVAVRAYGTTIALEEPKDAIQGVRVSAVLSGVGSLPELAMRDMYRWGLTREVTEELTWWMWGFPEMRERAARALVRISRETGNRGPGRSDAVPAGDTPGAPYDLLWRLAHTPDKIGATVSQLARLWHLACTHDSSRSTAWQMLGYWARSCRYYPDLSGTFATIADELEKAAVGDTEFCARLEVYRRRWNSYLNRRDDQ